MIEFQAILFDLDGVIIYSEDLHAQAKKLTLEKYGIEYPDHLFKDFKGRPDKVFWNHVSENLTHGVFPADELDSHKRKIFLELSESISIVPGALEFIAKAHEKFPRMALVTSTTEADMMISEKKFRFLKWFDVVQLGEHTLNHKPHPEPYLKALSRLGVSASRALVIEDSPNGVRSARAAGCKVIGITTGFTPSELNAAGTEYIVAGFNEIELLIDRVHPDE
ncbi:MAG TPA: HAD family phosphatase [Bacteroidales bacterium]|nr:HAD family phosphatase [Bacteroidales bacterium]